MSGILGISFGENKMTSADNAALPVTKTQRQNYLEGWKLYPLEALGHHIQGAIVGMMLMIGGASFIAVGAIWTTLYIAYQGLSVIRKGDSAGLDVADFLMGFWSGVGVFFVLDLLI